MQDQLPPHAQSAPIDESEVDSSQRDAELVEQISELIEAGAREAAAAKLAGRHAADVARCLNRLSLDDARQLLGWLPKEQAGAVLVELEAGFRAQLLEHEPPERIKSLIDQLDTDDAADVLADLPEELAAAVLPSLTDSRDLRLLLEYPEDTAGGIMATEYVAVQRRWSVARAVEELRRNADIVQEFVDVFVVNPQRRLEGTVSLKRLLLAAPEASIKEVMNTEVISVAPETDQEEVARIMERYDLITLAVVDDTRRLLGQVTIDDVVDVLREEAEEDMQRMSGVSGGEEATASIWRIVRGRLPWLLGGLVGAGLAALVVGSFEHALQQAVILAGFIPIVMATAGNVGIQSSAVAVQGLASGDVWDSDLAPRLAKELLVAVINGIAAALFIAALVLLAAQFAEFADPGKLALTAGLALIGVMVLAAIIGGTVPILLHRIGVDPALATGPFITTSNDILGVIVFFFAATRIYLA
jgi:magnesium transporter